ncbi:MAG: hypothetical protein HY324_03760 [Chlamydiia bacterium]|nr:hypothetical protein [Chlamydiia bacterium]
MTIDSSFLMKLWPFFFILPLIATVNEPLRLSLFSGYRNDRLHWHLQNGGTGVLTYSELYRNLQFWENGLDLRFIHRDLAFFLKGSYAAFGRGKLFQTYDHLSFTPLAPQFQFHSQAWAADVSGIFSYAVDLTPDRLYHVIFLPLVGFSGHFERIWSRGASPDPFTSHQAIDADSFSMSSSLPSPVHLTWYGPFLGAAFNVAPGNDLFFQAGYSYHWLDGHFSARYKEEIALNLGQSTSQEESQVQLKAKGNGNMGQSGWGQIEYALSCWRLGLGASMHYFSSTLLPAKITVTENSNQVETEHQKLKVRWTPISGWFIVSRSL